MWLICLFIFITGVLHCPWGNALEFFYLKIKKKKKNLILFMSVSQCFHFFEASAYLLLRSEGRNLVLVLSILKICICFSELPHDEHNLICSVNSGLSYSCSFFFSPPPPWRRGTTGICQVHKKRLVIIRDVTKPLYSCFICSAYLALLGIQIILVLLATISNNI